MRAGQPPYPLRAATSLWSRFGSAYRAVRSPPRPPVKRKSLLWQLFVSLSVVQTVVLFFAFGGLLYLLLDGRNTYISDGVIKTAAQAVRTSPAGLSIEHTERLEDLRRQYPSFWLMVADADGHSARYGNPPSYYTELSQQLAWIGPSEIHAYEERAPYGVRIDVKKVDGRRIHIMTGGASRDDLGRWVAVVSGVVSPIVSVPLILSTLVIAPLLIWRSMAGVRKLAQSAAAIDLSHRAVQLELDTVPREIRPLVAAFNEAIDRLRTTYVARDQFLRDAAHELRLPIAVLMARIDTMPKGPDKALLRADVSRLATLAEQLLDLQRIQAQGVQRTPVNLCEVARDVASDVAPLASAQGYCLEVDAPDDPVWVSAEPLSLGRVVTNLVQNAVVHGGGAGTISLRVVAPNTLRVCDQGPGVAEQDRERIFEPFYRAQTGDPGHGLGLHLALELVRRQNGHITVENLAEGGACFAVTFEALSQPQLPAPEPA
ncbi:Signal transduction histidine kinase [Luteibacter sp. UNCMF366Tsu5.1]|nr:Signal transduction histidine kinase [Luteibacter sp. UNCMF366Tsu5.1]